MPGWYREQLGLDYEGLSGLPENWVYNTGDEDNPIRRLVSSFLSPLASAYALVVALLYVASRPFRWWWALLGALLYVALLYTHTRAALVARQFGKPAVVGAEALQIDLGERVLRVGDHVIAEGEWLSIDTTVLDAGSPKNFQEVGVFADPSGLAPGIYEGSVRINLIVGTAAPQCPSAQELIGTVSVRLVVLPPASVPALTPLGGLVGALLTGVLAHAAWGGFDGLLFGNPRQVIVQAIGVVVVALYSGAASLALLAVVSRFAALRADRRTEGIGLDVLEHGEEAYTSGEGAILILPESGPRAAVTAGLRDPAATAAGGVP